MAVIEEVIRLESDGTLSFGDYLAKEKKKVSEFDVEGDIYKVKTYDQITRLEKNGKLLLEAVPGAAVHSLNIKESAIEFTIEGLRDTEITMELLPETTYDISIDGGSLRRVVSGLSGKITFSVEIDKQPLDVVIKQVE